jgi:hemoglobin-like flavoprotein
MIASSMTFSRPERSSNPLHLKPLRSLVPILQSLAMRHKGYGVNTAHYETVGGALMTTLEQGLGPFFTPQVRDSWSEVYGVMSSVMVAAAET